MELPELSLAPSSCKLTLESNSSSESSDTGSSRKRKTLSDGFLENNKSSRAHRSIDLQQNNERLPLDWEQCLDLESGKMYFLNRKTMKKSWDRPTAKDHQLHHHQRQKLDLELNISSSNPTRSAPETNKLCSSSYMKKLELMGVAQAIHNTRKDDHHQSSSSLASYSNNKQQEIMNNTNNNNMVAMACMNCHLLVIVSNSNRTCPNCKYVHCVPPAQQISPAPRNPTFKPLDTLSLFS